MIAKIEAFLAFSGIGLIGIGVWLVIGSFFIDLPSWWLIGSLGLACTIGVFGSLIVTADTPKDCEKHDAIYPDGAL